MSPASTKVIFLVILLLQSLTIPSVLARPWNPAPLPNRSESTLDRCFRIAFNAAASGDFDAARINYRRAAMIAENKCDRQHARFAILAAADAKSIFKKYGSRGKPTQGFANQLRKLTAPLSCVDKR